MRTDDAKHTAAELHALANHLETLAENADTLAAENVDTSTANSLYTDQEVAQQDLKQLISNLIQLHAESGAVNGGAGKHTLPLNGSVPIPNNANTQLPPPEVGKPSRGGKAPGWVDNSRITIEPADADES